MFSPDYVLRPLSEVAGYVQAHRHLPGIPSAKQVVNNGIDLTSMNAMLLEKVEELTLYSIQQDKTIQQQQNRLEQLELLVKQLLERK